VRPKTSQAVKNYHLSETNLGNLVAEQFNHEKKSFSNCRLIRVKTGRKRKSEQLSETHLFDVMDRKKMYHISLITAMHNPKFDQKSSRIS